MKKKELKQLAISVIITILLIMIFSLGISNKDVSFILSFFTVIIWLLFISLMTGSDKTWIGLDGKIKKSLYSLGTGEITKIKDYSYNKSYVGSCEYDISTRIVTSRILATESGRNFLFTEKYFGDYIGDERFVQILEEIIDIGGRKEYVQIKILD